MPQTLQRFKKVKNLRGMGENESGSKTTQKPGTRHKKNEIPEDTIPAIPGPASLLNIVSPQLNPPR